MPPVVPPAASRQSRSRGRGKEPHQGDGGTDLGLHLDIAAQDGSGYTLQLYGGEVDKSHQPGPPLGGIGRSSSRTPGLAGDVAEGSWRRHISTTCHALSRFVAAPA